MWIVPDTSILIPYVLSQHYQDNIDRALRSKRLALCSVVAAEIRAGAKDTFERRSYDRVFSLFGRRGISITPEDATWHACGRLISRGRERFGAMHVRDHQNDVLILLCARQLAREDETVILTENDKHFERWLGLAGSPARLRIEAMRH